MKYLITGITGFAGPHLANLLIRDGHEVFGFLPLTMIFAAAQFPLLQKYAVTEAGEK